MRKILSHEFLNANSNNFVVIFTSVSFSTGTENHLLQVRHLTFLSMNLPFITSMPVYLSALMYILCLFTLSESQ